MDLYQRIEHAGPDEVLLEIQPTIGRRIIGLGALGVLGGVLIWFGLTGQESIVARIILITSGAALVYFAQRLWITSDRNLILTSTSFRDSADNLICRLEDVDSVERGLNIFRPSNGFLINTRDPLGRAFAPGLWWRMGRRIGVGGLTNAGQAKAAVEVFQIILKKRDGVEQSNL